MPFGGRVLSIAGLHVAQRCGDPDLRGRLRPAEGPFSTGGVLADSIVDVSWTDLASAPAGEPVFESGGLWRLHRNDGQLTFSFTSPVFGAIPYKQATFDPGFAAGRVVLHRPYFQSRHSIDALEYPLDELLLLHLLPVRSGVELHGCGLVDADGSGYLFLGQSGAGKSTMASLWAGDAGVTVLSDDRIIVRRSGDRFVMHGTPWHGDACHSAAASAPLDAMFFLRQGPAPQRTGMTCPAVAARLFACVFAPFYAAAALERTLETLASLAALVPASELTFAPQPDVISLVRHTAGRAHVRPA